MRGKKEFKYTRQEAVDKLMASFKAYYDVFNMDDEKGELPLIARCDYYEHSEKYVVSRKAQLWAADCEEFVYLFEVPQLTLEMYEKCRDFAHEDGMKRSHIGPGHMYTYITPIFICDGCDADAAKALKKCNIYKSFKFSLHGWMDFHVAALEVSSNKIYTNWSGRCVEKVLKNVLFNTKKKRR